MRVAHLALVVAAAVATGLVALPMALLAHGGSASDAPEALVAALAVGAAPGLACRVRSVGRQARRGPVECGHRRQSLLDVVGEGIAWDCDADGRVTHASPQCLEILGYRPDEVRSLCLLDVVHPAERAELRRLLAAGQSWRHRLFRCLAQDGSPVWLRGSAVPVPAADGSPAGWSGVAYRIWDGPTSDGRREATSAVVRGMIGSSAVTIAFQPIVSLTSGRVVGAEGLARFPPTGATRTPHEWFTDAARVGLGVELELHAALMVLDAATALPRDVYVAVNLSPETIGWAGLADALTRSPIPPSRIVLEITEHSPVRDYDQLARALAPLRAAGIRLAVDDAGAGYASFRHILCLSPEFIKLDRTLISGIDADPARRALAAAVVMFAADVRATVIGEGIERVEELDVVRGLSVDAGQGFLLGRPTTDADEWLRWGKACVRPARPVVTGGWR